MWRGPSEYITYEILPTSPAVSCMSGSSNLDSFHDGWKLAVQLLLCGVLPSGLVLYYYGRALSSISEGVTRLVRAGRMTCKVRSDFEIITDVSSRVSLVTSNFRGSSICSPKSLCKKTSNEILGELKAVVKTGALKVPEAPTRPTPVCCDKHESNNQLSHTHTPSPPRGREKKELFELQWS